MKKTIDTKKIEFNPKVFGILAVFFIVLGIILVRGRTNYAVTADYDKVPFDDYVLDVSGYDVKDNVYMPNNEDPQILIKIDNDKNYIYAFTIKFAEEIDLSDVQVYFGRESDAFSENDSKLFGKGKTDTVEVLSLSPFKYARIDIDSAFEVKEFSVADELQKLNLLSYKWYVVIVVISMALALTLSFFKKIKYLLDVFFERIVIVVKKALKNKKRLLLRFFTIIFVFIAAYFLENIYGSMKEQDYFNRYRFLIIFAVITIPIITWWFRNNITKYGHIYFFIIVMFIGSINVYASPRACGISWDDIIHYGRASYMSWGCQDKIPLEAYNNIAAFSGSAMSKQSYSIIERLKWEEQFKQNKEYMLVETTNYELSQQYVSYIPSAIGLNIGRGMGLNYIDTFMLGKWMNLLCYALILSISIKLLRTRGKLIVMAIGLIPTSIFMATEYSYDWWVISLTILGYAIFLRDVQNKVKLTTKKMILIMSVMIIAMLPKAIYFPLIFPMLLLSKDRYEKPKTCRVIGTMAMIILIGTFILPIITGTGSSGDIRGGSGVNSTEQIKFILSQPIEYAKILVAFLMEYISPDNANGYLTFMAYYGQAKYYTVCLMVLVIAAVVDNNEIIDKKSDNAIIRSGGVLAVIGSVILAATALYISFTPVMNTTINGCQPRYLLPVVFTLIYYISGIKINVSEKVKSKTAMLICMVMSFIFLYGIYDLCIGYY